MAESALPANRTLARVQKNSQIQTIRFALYFLFKRAALIFGTIFIGVFITIVLINRPVHIGWGTMPPQLDANVELGIERALRNYQLTYPGYWDLTANQRSMVTAEFVTELREESGLDEPYLAKHIRWTFNALRFDWGRIAFTRASPQRFFDDGSSGFTLNDILVQYFPATLLLMGASYLLVFLLGLPLALHLSQNSNKFFDRFVSMIAPISSIPSWVIGILLITIVAVEMQLLPAYGMLDMFPPDTKWGYIPIILRHMILPVTAIFLSLFFQLVYSWRTVFLTFGNEDYVELGQAVGIPTKRLQRFYILKPTLPYVITSFSLTLISFWQMTMALETVFKWEGIGWLYVNVGLPNFWGESMYPGELIIALSLVVLFAYLLGAVVFILDIVYVFVDPRIKLKQRGESRRKARAVQAKGYGLRSFFVDLFAPRKKISTRKAVRSKDALHEMRFSLKYQLEQLGRGLGTFFVELRKFPSAVFGFSIVVLLFLGSIYAVIFLPYRQIGADWGRTTLTGKPAVPKLAQPIWTNTFRETDLLSTMFLDENSPEVRRIETVNEDGTKQFTISYSIDYPYGEFPSEMHLYLNGEFEDKKPFTAVSWITPDGREFNLKGTGVETYTYYDFDEFINARRMVSQNENLSAWFNFTQIHPTPFFHILFADPESTAPKVVNGVHELRLIGVTFEENSDISTELIMLGQVYGLAGTDVFRRDLTVPLFWGMPFALTVGLVGSVLTTVLSMMLAAMGVWFGGWVDDLMQLLTEVNMILPVIAIAVLAYAYLHLNIWVILILMVLLNVFGAPLKSFRSVLLQIKEAPYIEAAAAYGASSFRIIIKYMVPRIIPVLVPQLIILIPSFVFLEATLGLFNIDSGLPTWGTMIYQGLTKGALYGSRYWVLQPLFLLIMTGTAFSLFGSALERILNPRLLDK